MYSNAFRPQAFTPAWNRRQWVRWAAERYPDEPMSKFKQKKTSELIAIYHSL